MKTFKILGILIFLLLFSVGNFAQTLTSPDNGAIGVDPDLQVTWSTDANHGGHALVSCQIQASIGDPNFWAPQVDVTLDNVNTYTFSDLSIYTTYYWRVIATYEDDYQSTSLVRSFTVGDGSTTVNVPNLTMPVDKATWGVSTTPTLGWWYMASGTTTYIVSITSGSVNYSTETTNTSFTVPESVGLVYGTTYTWKVSADDGDNYSEEWIFTPTTNSTGTNKPNLSAPENNATWGVTTTPTLSWWYIVSGTTTYTISLRNASGAIDLNGAVAGNTVTTTSNSYTIPSSVGLEYGTKYYWTVTANGQPSDEWNFTPNTSSGGTAHLILNSPINGGIDKQSLTPTLSWRYEQASGTSFSYSLIVDDNIDFSSPEVNVIINDDATVSYTLETELDYSKTYFWKVKILGGTFTDPWSFTTIDAVTGTPVLAILDLEVTNDDLTGGETPAMTYDIEDGWQDVQGMVATGFSLQLDDLTTLSPDGLNSFYYLTLGSGTVATIPLQKNSYYPFYLDKVPGGFNDYWISRGINPTGTQPTSGYGHYMWPILRSEAPIFYIYVNSQGDYYLIDGLLHAMGEDSYFRVDDTYLTGNYTVVGDLSAPNIAHSDLDEEDAMTVAFNFNDGTLSELTLSDVGNGTTTVPFGSTAGVEVNLTLKNGFTFETSFFGKFTYDSDKLDFAYAECGSVLLNGEWSTSFYESLPGEISFITSVGTSQITQSGPLFTLYFTVIDNPDIGTSKNTLVEGAASEIYVDGQDSQLIVNSGRITYVHNDAASELRGDANLDFAITMDDAIAVINHVSEVTELEGQGAINAAVADGLGGISINDAMAILNYVATNTWDYTPSASVVGETVELAEPGFIATKLISLPVEISSAKEVKSVEVEFNYSTEDFDFQSFKAAKFGSGMYTTAKEVAPGKAILTFLAQEPITGTVKPGKISLNCLDTEASSEITTRYKLNSASEFKDGPSFNISNITDVANNGVLPSEFELSQNYPNPFNPTTMIQYSMPEAAFVSLKIYNLLGQEVKTLVSKEQTAGVFNVQWNGENNYGKKVTSGIYIYRIEAGNFIGSKKLILLK